MARSRSDYPPEKIRDDDSAWDKLDAAETRRQKKQKRITPDPKIVTASGSLSPSVDSPVTIVEPQATVFEPTASRSPLDDAEAEHVGIGQESVDEALEREGLRFLLPENLPDEDASSYNREEVISRLLKELKRFDAGEESQRPGWKKFSLKEKVLDLLESRRWNNKKSVQGKLLKEMRGTRDGNSTKDSKGKATSVSFAQGENLQEDVPREGHFGSPDYKEAIDDQVEIQPEKKRGIDADGIVEGFGVVEDASPEIVMEGDAEQKMGDVVSEKSGNSEGGENVLGGEYLPDGEESLQELRDRVKTLKGSSDEARNHFLTLRHRNTSKWLAVKKALFSLRSKEPPQALMDEMEVLKGDWNYKLTLYKDAVVELTKREAAERKLNGKEQGLLMAEAIRELDVRGSVENYDAWKNASWGDRKDSEFLRMLGRARDWAEEYRKLDWKKRMAISAVVVGTGVAGVAVGSAGLVGVGVAGSTIVRLLGSYGAGRGSYEFLEGRANQKTLQYHEAALSNVEKIEDIGFLEERMRSYADRTQKDLDRAIAGNRKRVAASVALGSVLFLGGTAFAHRGAIQEFSGKVSNEFSKFLEQMKIIAGFEDFHMAPVSISGGVADRAAEMAGAAKRVVIERAQEGVVLPDTSSGEIPRAIPTSPIVDAGAPVESGGFVSGNAGAGVIDGGQAAEAAGRIGKGEIQEVIVGNHSSILGAMNTMGTDGGDNYRAYLEFLEKLKAQGEDTVKLDKLFQGKTFPGDRVYIEIGVDGKPHILGIERESGGASLWKKFVQGFEETVRQKVELGSQPFSKLHPFTETALPRASLSDVSTSFPSSEINSDLPPDILDGVPPSKVLVPSPEDTLRGNIPLDTASSAPNFETASATATIPLGTAPENIPTSAPIPAYDFESLDLTVPGSEYLKNIGTAVNERLTFLPISQAQKDLIESIFSARIPTSGTEPTVSSVLFVRDTLGKALFSSEDAARWMQADIEHIKEKVNKAVYAGIVRIGGEPLRIGKMVAEGETVGSWLTKMARHILTHPIEIKN